MKKQSSIILALCLFVLSCHNKVQLSLEIEVVTNENVQVSEAQVFLDQKLLGQTNKEGKFIYQSPEKAGKRILSISKEDNTQNYSMYKEEITISKTEPNLRINAKLYTVPKIDIADNKTKKISQDQDSKLIKEDELKLSEEDTEAIKVKKEESDPIVMSASADNISLKNSSTTKDHKTITIYTKNAKSQAIPGVKISYKNTTDNEFESGCISNETGRCVLPYQGKDRSIDLLYQQNGMQTKLDTVEVSNEKVINTVLTPGKTLDVLVYSDKLGKKIPEEATVLINQKPARKIGKGFYSYNFFNAKTKTVSLKVQSPIGTKLQKIDTSKGSKVVTVSLENKKKK